jgi:hypothetical protein
VRLVRLLPLLALGAALSPPAASAAIQARTTLSPQPAFLGDVVRAQLTVSAPDAAQAEPSFGPFRALSSSRSVERSGGQVVTRFTYRLQCLAAVCSPGPGRRLVTLPAVTVRAGGASRAVRWPAAAVEPRVTQAEVANPTASFRRQTAVPAPDWARSPKTIRRVLYVVAALLVAIAVVLVAPLLRRRARRRAPEPLDVALARVRESVGRPPDDRRRALDLLARTLARAGDADRARLAAALAWAEPAPEPGRLSALADQVEAAR